MINCRRAIGKCVPNCNVGTVLVDNIVKERTANGPYKSFTDFCERIVDEAVSNEKPKFVDGQKIKYPEYFRESIIEKELNKKIKEFLKSEERKMTGEKIKRAKQNKKERER